jgi:hypothetical protein
MSKNSASATDPAATRAALQTLLDALAPLLLRARITPAMVEEAVRLSFVRAAAATARMGSGRINHSRIATLTGLSRLEVRRLFAAPQRRSPPPRQLDRAVRVLEGWSRDAAFRNAQGRPLALPLRGPAPSFEALVRRYGGDVPPSAVQAELEAAGVAAVSRGHIRLKRRRLAAEPGDQPHPLPQLAPYLGGMLRALEPPAATLEWTHQLRIPVGDATEATLVADRARRTLSAAVSAIRAVPHARRRRSTAAASAARSVAITVIMTGPPQESAP